MSSQNAKSKASTDPRITERDVDRCVNALLTALTTDLGRPFLAGGVRSFRSIISAFSPVQRTEVGDVSPSDFARDYLVSSFLDRYIYDSEASEDQSRQELAREKFRVNLQRGWYFNETLHDMDDFGETILASASYHIAQVLGDFSIEEMFSLSDHGPNATLGVKWLDAYPDVKDLTLEGTRPCLDLYYQSYLPWLGRHGPELWAMAISDGDGAYVEAEVGGNNLSFVPKNWKIFRTMSAEPTQNMRFQLGLGKMIEKRLRKAHIDLSTQPQVHKDLTLQASAFPEIGLATLDWSEASDRMWLTLVSRLFAGAPEWWHIMCAIRSPVTTIDGEVVPLPMVSTMGCGFTFPLQTLIFWAICTACVEFHSLASQDAGDDLLYVSTFGDDCIVPSCVVPLVERWATTVGWKLNADKSYSSGWFRESCGMHAYRGVDATPFRPQRPKQGDLRPNSVKAWLYTLYNSVIQLPCMRPYHENVDAWLSEHHRLWQLGSVLVVPPYFPQDSGARSESPTSNVPGCLQPEYRDQMWHFRRLIVTNQQRRVPHEETYLRRTLAGFPLLPREWRAENLPLTSSDPTFSGFLPERGSSRFESKGASVHVWTYGTLDEGRASCKYWLYFPIKDLVV